MSTFRDPLHLRTKLAEARLMLIFSPDLCAGSDPLAVLEAVLGSVDIVQIRPKALAGSTQRPSPSSARDVYEWSVRALDVFDAHPDLDVPLIVDDRVDVAAALWSRGCAGVHLGQDDCPIEAARLVLGTDPLIGFSTHSLSQVAHANELAVDYLGFGPIHATMTKGYTRGLGAEACWIACTGSEKPVFPIGGIDFTNAGELARIGRAAVGSAILRAEDPARAAREIRALLALA